MKCYRLLTRETMIRERSVPTRNTSEHTNAPFIDFTICPSYEAAYKNGALQYYGIKKSDYRYRGVYFNNNVDSYNKPRAIFDSITHNVSELLYLMTIFTRTRKQARLEIYFNATNSSDLIHITTKYRYSLGRCYSIHPKDPVLKLGLLKVEFVAWMDIYVYFGYPGQFMDPDTKTKVRVFTMILYHF